MIHLISDVDGPLLIDRAPEFISWANSQPEVRVPWSYALILKTGDWGIATNHILPENISVLFNQFLRSQACPIMQVTPGAAITLRHIPSPSRYIATSRAHTLQEITMGFLEKHCGPFFGSSFQACMETKAKLSRDLAAQYFIDDDPNVLRMVRQLSPKTQPVLFPSRAQRRLTNIDGITVLSAESRVTNTENIHQHLTTCLHAWREISTILQNCSHQH